RDARLPARAGSFSCPEAAIRPQNQRSAQSGENQTFRAPPANAGLLLLAGSVRKKKFTKPAVAYSENGSNGGSVMPKQRQVREVSDEEIHQLLREVERQSAPPVPDAR